MSIVKILVLVFHGSVVLGKALVVEGLSMLVFGGGDGQV